VSVTVDQLADVIGRPGATALCCVFGGTRWYCPINPPPDSPIVVLLGSIMAANLAAIYGGCEIDVPMPDVAKARRAEALRLREVGHTVREIATALGVSERSVFRMLA
jgi:hypothetical protein